MTVRTDDTVVWAEPVGLAMLSAWSRFQRERAGRAVLVDDSVRGPFTWRSGLLSALSGRPRAGGSVVGHALHPTLFASEPDLQGLEGLVEKLEIPDAAIHDTAIHIIEDLARNVFHHASSRGGGAHVAALYDPSERTLRIGVADCGQGIARDMRAHLSEDLGDVDAVAAAMEPEISGSSQPGINRGVGLYVVRRLTLACRGALWLKSGGVLVDISPRTPDAIVVDPVVEGAEWSGCAVGVMLRLGSITSFQSSMESIRRDLEHRELGPHPIQFFKRDSPEDPWPAIPIEPDTGVIASDRIRARSVAAEQIEPGLRLGHNISLHFTRTRYATQAFCHALLVTACEQFGVVVLERVRFIACSNQVMTVLRMALEYGLRQGTVPEHPRF